MRHMLSGDKAMPREDLKILADEEVARRLHEELNPESSPIASATRRLRKAPTFYSPPVNPSPRTDITLSTSQLSCSLRRPLTWLACMCDASTSHLYFSD